MLADTASPTVYEVEHRAIADDAWYSAQTVFDGEKLTVKYENFGDDHDIVFQVQDFNSFEEIEEFKQRFRPVSDQLQDGQCKHLAQGTVVCASQSSDDNDNRFYDAVLDDVIYRDHSFANGGEQCTCTFVVIWQHGPLAGCLANKKIESVCLVHSNAKLDPSVANFYKTVREKLATSAHEPRLLYNCNNLNENITSFPVKAQSTFIPLTQETECARLFVSSKWKSEEIERLFNHTQRNKEDTDVGGNATRVVLIDNLDKDLSPSSIVAFIHSQTSISVQAYVFPSLPYESYTNGVILLDCEQDPQKLCEFLDSPNHIIMSCRGRPWLMTKMLSGHDTVRLRTLMAKYQNKLEHKNIGISSIKVVYSGSEEYKTAKQLRDLFMEFVEHQQQLHRTLAFEEKKILQQSHAA